MIFYKNAKNIMSESPDKIKIYTDGSCLGNPWPWWYGAVLMFGDHVKTIRWWATDTTNNRMELKAVIHWLDELKKYNIPVYMYVDSKYVKDGITKYIDKWKQNGWKTSSNNDVKNKDLWQQLDKKVDKIDKISWSWVKAHDGNHMNELVDKIAKKKAHEYQG